MWRVYNDTAEPYPPWRFPVRARTRPLSHAEHTNADGHAAGSMPGARRRVRSDSPTYRTRTEAPAQRANRRLAVAFRIVSALGALSIAAGALASVFSLAAPPAVAHGSLSVAVTTKEPGLLGATRSLAEPHDAPLLTPSAQWLSAEAGESALGADPVREATIKTPVVVPPPAAPAPSKLAASSAGKGESITKRRSRGTITIETFGFSFADAPGGSERVADVRNVPADGFTQDETGLMLSVRERVMATSEAQTWRSYMREKWMPTLDDGDKVAIGCSRGHHRSVTLAVLFAEDLRAAGYTVKLVHRDIQKTW